MQIYYFRKDRLNMKNKTYLYLNKTGYFLLVFLCVVSLIFTGLLPKLWGYLIDNLINGNYEYTIKLFSLYFFVSIAFKFSEYMRQYQFSKQKRILEFNIKKVLLNNQLNMNYLKFNDINSGEFVSRFHSDVTEISKFWLDTVINVSINFIFVFIFIVNLYKINKIIALFVMTNSVIITILNKYFKNKFQNQYSVTRGIADKYFDSMYETLSSMVAIKVRGLKKITYDRNVKIFSDIKIEETKLMKIKYFSEFIVSTIPILNIIFSIFIMLPKIINGVYSIGTLMSVLYLLPILEDKISLIITSALSYETFKISNERLNWLINPNDEDIEHFGKEIVEDINSISFNDVIYKYPTSDVHVGPVNFSVSKGGKVALIGESGSGKTTLFRLLTRLINPRSGYIFVNDAMNIEELNETNIRKSIYMVTQESEIFTGSVKENLTKGMKNELEDEKIKLILERLGLSKFSNHLDYHITEKGRNISGGEKQRLEIARAILSDSEVIILDEPYASVDNESIYYISSMLNYISKDKIIMLSSHRLDPIKGYDQIILFKNGKILDYGTHEELLRKSDYYNELLSNERSSDDQ